MNRRKFIFGGLLLPVLAIPTVAINTNDDASLLVKINRLLPPNGDLESRLVAYKDGVPHIHIYMDGRHTSGNLGEIVSSIRCSKLHTMGDKEFNNYVHSCIDSIYTQHNLHLQNTRPLWDPAWINRA